MVDGARARPGARLVLTHSTPTTSDQRRLAGADNAPEVVPGRFDRAMAVAAWEQGSDHEFGYLGDHGPRRPPRPGPRAARCAPSTPTRLVDEDSGGAGRRSFRVLPHRPGHADGHIALVGETTAAWAAMCCSTITPNVGGSPDAARDPLGRYLATLRRLWSWRRGVSTPVTAP